MTKIIEEVLTISQGNFKKNIAITKSGIIDLLVYGTTIDSKRIDKYIPYISLCDSIFRFVNTSTLKKHEEIRNFIYFIKREHDRLKTDEKYSKITSDWDFYFDTFKKSMNYHYKDLQDVKEFKYSMFRITRNKDDYNSSTLIPFDPEYLENLKSRLEYVSTIEDFIYYYILINTYVNELKFNFKIDEEKINSLLEELESRKVSICKKGAYSQVFEDRKKRFSYNIEKVDNPYTSSYELMRLIYANSDLPTSIMLYDNLKQAIDQYNNDDKKSCAVILATLYGIMESYNLSNELLCLKNIISKAGEKKAIEGIIRFISNVSINSKIADLLNDDFLNLGGRSI